MLETDVDLFVNTTSDVADFGGDQQLPDLPGPDAVVSLREANMAANNTSGLQVIGLIYRQPIRNLMGCVYNKT